MKVTYSSDGTTEILGSLGRLKSEQLLTARDVCKQAARDIVNDARSRVPVRTGKLRRAIHHAIKTRKGEFEIGFGWRAKAYYGFFIEYGTKRQAAHPFLRPAFDARTQGLEERIGDAIEGLMK